MIELENEVGRKGERRELEGLGVSSKKKKNQKKKKTSWECYIYTQLFNTTVETERSLPGQRRQSNTE